MSDALVIGAGLGGLSAALHLAAAGRKVTVVEKNPAVGGKMNWFEKDGFRFDTGPTLLTMPFVLRDLFHTLGETLEDHLQLVPVEPVCRYFFADKSRLDISSDLKKTTENLGRFNPAETGNFVHFLNRGKEIYKIAAQPFLFSTFGEWGLDYFLRNLKFLFRIWKLDSFRTLHDAVSAAFHDNRLVQLFDRFATYNGSSPYKTPATFAIIPYVEFAMGGWYVRGGMYSIAESLAKLAIRKGIEIRTGTPCEEILIENGRAAGVRLGDGSRLRASCVVANADALDVYERLLPSGGRSRQAAPQAISSSGFVLLLGVDKTYSQLAHHNIFFSDDYKKEFEDIFERGIPPEDPTVYVSVSSRTDPAMAPAAGSNMFVMVNVPAVNGNFDWNKNKASYRQLVLNRLKAAGQPGQAAGGGLDRQALAGGLGLEDLEEHIRVEKILTPLDFQAKYRAFRGALYGFASNSPWSAFLRPPNRAREVRGLYFTGGSTHPGGGIPLVLLSGKMTAEIILKREKSGQS